VGDGLRLVGLLLRDRGGKGFFHNNLTVVPSMELRWFFRHHLPQLGFGLQDDFGHGEGARARRWPRWWMFIALFCHRCGHGKPALIIPKPATGWWRENGGVHPRRRRFQSLSKLSPLIPNGDSFRRKWVG
jgi:hypothetical protein